MMREISSYCLKVVDVERILSDLDIVSTIALKMNVTTSNEILYALKLEQGSDFIEQKQAEFNSILKLQKKRIEQLRYLLNKIERHVRQTSNQCGVQLTSNIRSSTSTDLSTAISSNSVQSKSLTNPKKLRS